MSNLIKYEICPSLNDGEKAIVLASKTKPLCLLNTRSIAEELLSPFKELFIYTGHKVPKEEDCVAQIKAFSEKIKKKFPNVKINEIILAIKSGAFGDYGDEVVHVSPKNMLKWVGDYQACKHDAIKKQLEFEREQNKKNESEKHIENQRIYFAGYHHKIAQRYGEFLKSGIMPSLSSMDYEILTDIGLIEETKEERRAIWKIASDVEKSRREKMNPFERRRLRFEPELSKQKAIIKIAREISLKNNYEAWKVFLSQEDFALKVEKLVNDNINKLIKNR